VTSPDRANLVAGTTLGRYTLVNRIGEGGMGEVWKAHDANLDRHVAIKMLLRGALDDATTRERFRREALVLSRLSHSGVATIFDFDARDGCDFLVMEYVSGGTLEARLAAGPMPIDEAIDVGIAIAAALDNAHRNGFLHRDLKPANVALTAEGQPKILDFGLALLLAGAKATGHLTQTGMIVGSLPYMAPEQLLGEADDARTDVYALGVMLFEMVTGKRPIEKERPEALMFAIINTAAPGARSLRPDIPAALDQLLSDCLRKDPEQRPNSAAAIGDVLRDIRDGTSSAARTLAAPVAIRSIAVLPLRNVAGDPTQEYFVDGMTEAIISDLSRIKALRVISRTSAMKYKNSALSLPEIARELNVDAVLEGSALLIGNRVRVSVQLISARADDTLWADRYDRELEDVLGLQSELAQTVAREIAIQLSPAEETQFGNRPAVNPEAHIEFLKSRHSTLAGTREALDLGFRHAKRALEIDPNFALAWSALADTQILRAIRGMAPPAEAAAEAAAAANRALELDPSLADAHASIGIILTHTGRLKEGIREFERAIELNPGNVMAYNVMARALMSFERHEEALAAVQKSVSLDPLSSLIHTGLGDVYYFAREYEKSAFTYLMSVELDPRFDGAHTDRARALEALGRFDEARAEYEEGRRLAGGAAGASFGLGHLEAASGNEAQARLILAELTAARSTRVVSAWGIAALHASLGDVDDAFRWMEIAVEEKASGLILLRVHPRLDPIRNDPRYWPLVVRVGLAD
jgi:serine/threonine protein kinase/tetratricopeptide (TPR) repeat protein